MVRRAFYSGLTPGATFCRRYAAGGGQCPPHGSLVIFGGRLIIPFMGRKVSRRRFLGGSAAAIGLAQAGCSNLFFVGKRGRPVASAGVASGDVTADSAVVWS